MTSLDKIFALIKHQIFKFTTSHTIRSHTKCKQSYCSTTFFLSSSASTICNTRRPVTNVQNPYPFLVPGFTRRPAFTLRRIPSPTSRRIYIFALAKLALNLVLVPWSRCLPWRAHHVPMHRLAAAGSYDIFWINPHKRGGGIDGVMQARQRSSLVCRTCYPKASFIRLQPTHAQPRYTGEEV